jgi:hypothetical protein
MPGEDLRQDSIDASRREKGGLLAEKLLRWG